MGTVEFVSFRKAVNTARHKGQVGAVQCEVRFGAFERTLQPNPFPHGVILVNLMKNVMPESNQFSPGAVQVWWERATGTTTPRLLTLTATHLYWFTTLIFSTSTTKTRISVYGR